MKCPPVLNRLWGKGLDVILVAGNLEVTGGDDLEQDVYDGLLQELAREKRQAVAFLREDAYACLVELVRHHGLRFGVHEGGALWPNYPRRFTPHDRLYVQGLFLQASPLPHERAHDLLGLQDRVRVLLDPQRRRGPKTARPG